MQHETVGGLLLYVEDDATLREQVSVTLRERHAQVRGVSSATEARHLARHNARWCGFIASDSLPDGRGLDLIRELRHLHGRLPAILTAEELSRELANACCREQVQYVVKSFGPEELDPFVERLARFEGDLEHMLLRLTTCISASPREAEVMRMVLLHQRTNANVAAELRLSINTVKSCVRRILTKARAGSMRELRLRLRIASEDT